MSQSQVIAQVPQPEITSTGTLPVDEALLDGTLIDLFTQATERYEPEQVCLAVKRDGAWVTRDFQTVRREYLGVAAALVDLKVKFGDRVAIMSANRPEWVLADAGILHAGAASVPIYDTLTAEQVGYILDDAGCVAAFVQNEALLEKMLEVRYQLDALGTIIVFDPPAGELPDGVVAFSDLLRGGLDATKKTRDAAEKRMAKVKQSDLASLVYTSGTTGDPKGVMLTHNNFLSNAVGGLMRLPLPQGTMVLSFLPLSHAFERIAGYYIMFLAGATIYYAESVPKVPENILEVRPQVMASVPRLYEKMYAKIKANVDSSSFVKRKIFNWALGVGEQHAQLVARGQPIPDRLQKKYDRAHKMVFSKIHAKMGGRLSFFVSGGAALSPEVEVFFNSLGVRIFQGYGLTETSPVATVNAPGETRFGSVGRVIPGVEVDIAADGEVLVRGRNVMQGYWNKPDDTAATLIDGWLHTGDIGKIDDEGFLYITDRKKELFVLSNGKNVAPQPIENLIKTYPSVAQAVLIGDGRNYCTALIAPDFEALFTKLGVTSLRRNDGMIDTEAMIQRADVQKLIKDDIDAANKRLARYEQIKRFRILPREFTLEAGELTPTLKIKRRVIDEMHAELIAGLYATSGPDTNSTNGSGH